MSAYVPVTEQVSRAITSINTHLRSVVACAHGRSPPSLTHSDKSLAPRRWRNRRSPYLRNTITTSCAGADMSHMIKLGPSQRAISKVKLFPPFKFPTSDLYFRSNVLTRGKRARAQGYGDRGVLVHLGCNHSAAELYPFKIFFRLTTRSDLKLPALKLCNAGGRMRVAAHKVLDQRVFSPSARTSGAPKKVDHHLR
ncbi:hypothetical protein EVAR_103672_1 [Eumeta japonica]|uniref:Uncharacterized protein n=1 Tax=Eumeta variegata TaxID=151549 RepID=A0A4C1Z4W1_EUMVA|nr:hypothetical protein EVAR_103672_1 [Eumeta japonica]